MDIETKILTLIEPSLNYDGYDVVRVKYSGVERRTLQIMIDRLDGKNITLEDCETVSYQVSAILDIEDPITDHYNLEISSPGLDRPLTRLKDFERFKGMDAKIKTLIPFDNRRNFTCKINKVEGEQVLITPTGENIEVAINFADISTAKLIASDELINKNKNKKPGGKKND